MLQEYRLSAFVDVGLYQYRSVYTEQQTEDAVNEEQVIKSQSTTVQEIQVGYNYRSTLNQVKVKGRSSLWLLILLGKIMFGREMAMENY